MIQGLKRISARLPLGHQDHWALLSLILALALRQSPAEAALTAIGVRIALERVRRGLSRLV